MIPDTNLLIYAHDSTSPQHDVARDWWEATLSGREPVSIPFVVLMAFMRLVTHPMINQNPMSVSSAREIIDSWEAVPVVQFISGRSGTLKLAWDLLESTQAGGNLTTDAVIAAHALEAGATIYSNDRDFDRFSELKWLNPLT
ncbi:MAG: TA system VapC family ribonuclease toxin [Verrucomicrobiota bacterium]